MVCFWGELQKKQKMHNVNCDLVWRMMVRSATTLSIDRARFLSSKKRRSTGVKVELDDQVQGICPSDEFEVAEFSFQFVKDLPAADRELVKMCEAGKSCLEISSVFEVSPQVIYRKIRTIRILWLTRSITAGWHRPIAQ